MPASHLKSNKEDYIVAYSILSSFILTCLLSQFEANDSKKSDKGTRVSLRKVF